MKLSTLVHYRNLLEKYTPNDLPFVINGGTGHVKHLVNEHDIQFPRLTQQLNQEYQSILSSFNRFKGTIGDIQAEIESLIGSIESEYFSKSYQLYEQFFQQDKPDYILNRRLSLTDEIMDYLHGRIRSHGNWHYSAMIIRPGLEDWIHDLVACDPLYLVDREMDMLSPSMNRFNPTYQRRLRTYFVKHIEDGQLLGALPDNQLGFCLVYNFFNFKPLEIIRSYFKEIYQKLRPGGTIGFTFNNCDRSGAVELVERNFMCYTPGRLLLSLCESIGYRIIQTYQLDAACTWVEMRKPGELTSLRGGQSMAKIVAKSK